jgi:5-methylcytosine-specific restriction endonuclease McrA
MNKKERLQVYNKYGGHCAYCGNVIELKDMQVDHIIPQCRLEYGIDRQQMDSIKNLNPSCHRCNHYKRTASLETFRKMLKTLHERTQKIYINKVAEDYGIIKVEPWDGEFYYEKVNHGPERS